MITETTGDLLADDAEVLVNTVNCVGVMGKGIALAFKQHYPTMFQTYRRQCAQGLITPGSVSVWEPEGLEPLILNVATKDHWRAPSQLPWISQALIQIQTFAQERQIATLALPPLGCGNGGLDWNHVRPLIHEALDQALPDTNVRLYLPGR